jgi:hypothetical protein
MSASAGEGGESERLLKHLGRAGAFATESPFGCGRIALYRTVRGASLGGGYVSALAAQELVEAGHAAWSGQGRARRLQRMEAPPVRSLALAAMAVDGVIQNVILDERESPLLGLHRRPGKDGKPQVSAAEFAAGERFRSDLTLAQMLPRVTVNWDAGLAAGTHAPSRDAASASDASLAARQRVRLACKRLGPELSGLAIDVCGFLKGLDAVERERGWPARSAKVVLRLALTALAEHYGLAGTAAYRPAAYSAWQAGDARPVIPPRA